MISISLHPCESGSESGSEGRATVGLSLSASARAKTSSIDYASILVRLRRGPALDQSSVPGSTLDGEEYGQQRVRSVFVAAALVLGSATGSTAASGADVGPPAPRGLLASVRDSGSPRAHTRLGTTVRFLGGAALGLGLHEGSHVLADHAFGVDVGIRRVEFVGVPFFALGHPGGLPARQEYVISSAGIWSQHLTSEWILTARPGIRQEQAPFLKGVLAFDILLSTGYGLAAVAQVGPPERDPRGMAVGSGLPEPLVGGLLLAPAVLDTWRYHRPAAKWPRRISRLVKVGLVIVAFTDLPL